MADGDFSMHPTWVQLKEPEYNTIESKSENMKKDRQIISANVQYFLRMEFTGLSDANFATLWTHFVGRKGSYLSFAWINAYIPSYIKTALGITTGNLTIRWVKGTFSPTARAHGWDVTVEAETEVT